MRHGSMQCASLGDVQGNLHGHDEAPAGVLKTIPFCFLREDEPYCMLETMPDFLSPKLEIACLHSIAIVATETPGA